MQNNIRNLKTSSLIHIVIGKETRKHRFPLSIYDYFDLLLINKSSATNFFSILITLLLETVAWSWWNWHNWIFWFTSSSFKQTTVPEATCMKYRQWLHYTSLTKWITLMTWLMMNSGDSIANVLYERSKHLHLLKSRMLLNLKNYFDWIS